MKTFAREFGHDYSNYRFGYCRYAEVEGLEEIPEVYAGGYLPYSGDPADPRHLFYMARSLRVPLGQPIFGKSRRYLQRRFETETGIEFRVHEKVEFLAAAGKSGELEARVESWVGMRFGQSYMGRERLHYVLSKPWLNTLFEARAEGRAIAYALVCRWPDAAHFWFSFYDPQFRPELSPGLWLMGRSMEWAAGQQLRHIYLGTVYAPSSAYKFQGVNRCEFWDGSAWNADRDLLRASLRA